MNFRCLTALAFAVCLLLSSGCAVTPSAQAGSMPIGEPIQIQAPPELPPVHVPADNTPAAETIYVDRRLDYGKKFSQTRKDLAAFPESLTGEIPPQVGVPV